MRTADYDAERLWRFRARLVRVIDADTAVVEADTGFGGRHEAHIRLANYSGPERNTPDGPEATRRLADALARGVGAWPLRLTSLQRETVVAEVRSFERYVGFLATVEPDGSLSDVGERLCVGSSSS